MSRLHLVFKWSTEGTFESMVKMVAGPMIHVDAVPQAAGKPVGKAYTSYMFETFSENDCLYSPIAYTSLTLNITPEEHDSVVEFFRGYVDRKLPYNYSDIMLCKTPAKYVMKDVVGEPKSVFCSQAMVLCLKQCISSIEGLAVALAPLNSRTTTPQALYVALKFFCDGETVLHEDLPQIGRSPPPEPVASGDI